MGEKIERLKLLWSLNQREQIDLYFADESGFQLVPNLPYGWQAKGQYIRMLPRKGKTLSVFGLLGTDNHLVSYPTEQNTNADFIIQCLDDFMKRFSALNAKTANKFRVISLYPSKNEVLIMLF